VAALALTLAVAAPAAADRLHLTGRLIDPSGLPLAGETFRLVLGSDPTPRAPDPGRVLTTDAQGRFTLEAPITPRPRRIRLDSVLQRHDSRLLELGWAFDLIGHPALYWVEVDVTRFGPVRGIAAFVAGAGGAFDLPLRFHSREHAWSIPGDPRGLRLSQIGADVQIEGANAGEGGHWRLDVVVTRARFEMR
jgi:hypothetical protein